MTDNNQDTATVILSAEYAYSRGEFRDYLALNDGVGYEDTDEGFRAWAVDMTDVDGVEALPAPEDVRITPAQTPVFVIWHPGSGTFVAANEAFLIDVNDLPDNFDEWEEAAPGAAAIPLSDLTQNL